VLSLAGAGNACWFGAAPEKDSFTVDATTLVGCTGETAGACKPSCTPVRTAAALAMMDSVF
jgi:hypothetical protein